MRLFTTENIFKVHHLTSALDPERFLDTARIWTPPAGCFPGQTANYMKPLCSSCQVRRKEDIFGKELFDTMPSLYCSGCKSSHKNMHFSAIMRGEKNDDERLCLGHEVPLKICNHHWITLNQVKMLARYEPNEKFSCQWHSLCGRYEDPRTCASPSCSYDGRPVIRCYIDDSGNTRLHMEFAVHINFKKVPSGKACPHSLRKELREITEKIPAVGNWRDDLFLGKADMERCFDPNICDCVEYIPPSHQGTHIRFQVRSEHKIPIQEPAPAEGHPYISTTGRCAFTRHGFTAHYTGVEINVDFLRCKDRSDLLIFRQTVDCLADTRYASGSGWGTLVTRLSSHIGLDEYLNGLVSCTNYECGLYKLSIFNKNAALFLG